MSNQITPSQPIKALVTIKSLMGSQKIKERFNEILGKNSAGFISSVLSVANSPAVAGADPNTIMSAAVVAATLDLPVNPNLGFAYIVAYNDKRLGKQAQFQMGYKGFIQLAMRSGQYRVINATDVREGELIEEDLLTGEIKLKKLPATERKKAKVIGYSAFFRLNNGCEKSFYMSREDMEDHAKQYSQSYRNDRYGTSLWSTKFDTMALKTVLKLLLSKWGPLSVNMQMAHDFDQSVSHIDPVNDNIEEVTPEYIDNQPEQHEDPAEVAASRAAAMEAASSQFAANPDANQPEATAPSTDQAPETSNDKFTLF